MSWGVAGYDEVRHAAHGGDPVLETDYLMGNMADPSAWRIMINYKLMLNACLAA